MTHSAPQAAGYAAEEKAARFLAANGLAIVARNFRTRLGEIDLVARDGETLVFVEVRLRTNPHFGGAAGSVDRSKRSRLAAAAGQYLASLGAEPPCRFDVVTLDGDSAQWIRAAFDVAG
jgi:putative endonuclease